MSHSELGSSDSFRSQTSRAPPKVPQIPCKARVRKDPSDEWSETDSDDEDGHGELTFDAAAPAASACESRLHMLYKDDTGSEVRPAQTCNPCIDKGEDTGMSFRQMVEQAKEVKAFVKDTVKRYGVPCDADQLFADWWSCAAALRKPTFAKGDKAARMLELLQAGTGATSLHPAQYELLHEARSSITLSTLEKAGRKGAEWWPRFLSFLVAVGQVAETRVPLSDRPAPPRPSKREVKYEADAVIGGFDGLQRVWRRDPALRAVHGIGGGNVNVLAGQSQREREIQQKQDFENRVQWRIDRGDRTAYGKKAPFHTDRSNRRRQRRRRRIKAAQMSSVSPHAPSGGSPSGSELSSGGSGLAPQAGAAYAPQSFPPSGDWSPIFAPAFWKAQDMAVKIIGQDALARAQASGGDTFVAHAEVFVNSQRLPQPVPLWETTRKVVQYITSQAGVPANQLLLVPFGHEVPADMSGALSLQSLQSLATSSGSTTADRFCDAIAGLAPHKHHRRHNGELIRLSPRWRGLWKVALVTAGSAAAAPARLAAPVGKTHHDRAADMIAAGFVAAVTAVAAIGWQIVRAQRA